LFVKLQTSKPDHADSAGSNIVPRSDDFCKRSKSQNAKFPPIQQA